MSSTPTIRPVGGQNNRPSFRTNPTPGSNTSFRKNRFGHTVVAHQGDTGDESPLGDDPMIDVGLVDGVLTARPRSILDFADRIADDLSSGRARRDMQAMQAAHGGRFQVMPDGFLSQHLGPPSTGSDQVGFFDDVSGYGEPDDDFGDSDYEGYEGVEDPLDTTQGMRPIGDSIEDDDPDSEDVDHHEEEDSEEGASGEEDGEESDYNLVARGERARRKSVYLADNPMAEIERLSEGLRMGTPVATRVSGGSGFTPFGPGAGRSRNAASGAFSPKSASNPAIVSSERRRREPVREASKPTQTPAHTSVARRDVSAASSSCVAGNGTSPRCARFCVACGVRFGDRHKFCGECGAARE